MSEINIEEIEPGMVLDQDAMHLNGRVLLAAGTTLTSDHLRMLKAWGVFALSVTGTAPAREGVSGPATLSDEALMARFRHADLSHPLVAALYRYRQQLAR